LNQGKREFFEERDEYKASTLAWYSDFLRKFGSNRSRFQGGELNISSKEFRVTNNYMGEFQVVRQPTNPSFHSSTYINQSSTLNQSMNTTMMSGISGQQPAHGEHSRSFKTREFYFLKQGIFEHRLFSKYIVKCRKERHFLDFGKKKRDEVLLEEQLALTGG